MYATVRTEWQGYKVRVYYEFNVHPYRWYSVVFRGPGGYKKIVTLRIPRSKKYPRMRALRDGLREIWDSVSESESSECRNAANVLWLSAYEQYRWLTRDGDNW